MRLIPKAGVDLVKSFETDVLRVYDDRQPKVILTADTKIIGVLTAGYGHTDPTLRWDTPVDQAQADLWFNHDSITKVINPIYNKLGALVDQLTDNQYSALCSFVYNLGTGDPKKPEWTIWKRLRAKQFDQVPQELAKFVNWDGKKSLGLVRRRAAEQVLWSTDEPGTEDTNPPATVTRADPTPPTVADPTPLVKQTPFITSVTSAAVTTVAGISAAADKGINISTQFSDHSQLAAHAVEIFGTIGFIAGIAVPVLIWLRDRQLKH